MICLSFANIQQGYPIWRDGGLFPMKGLSRFMDEKIVQECVKISIAINQTNMQGSVSMTCRYVTITSEEILMTLSWVTCVILSEIFIGIKSWGLHQNPASQRCYYLQLDF